MTEDKHQVPLDVDKALANIRTSADKYPDHFIVTWPTDIVEVVDTMIAREREHVTALSAENAKLQAQVTTLHLHLGRLLDLLDDTETAMDYADYDEARSAWEDTCPTNSNQDKEIS